MNSKRIFNSLRLDDGLYQKPLAEMCGHSKKIYIFIAGAIIKSIINEYTAFFQVILWTRLCLKNVFMIRKLFDSQKVSK